ncbi:MAG: hypothetical protein JWN13_1846 [Betaproteobacteria bacterium]|nr:hypothetical protein [Betaproteobacteria bacterium]
MPRRNDPTRRLPKKTISANATKVWRSRIDKKRTRHPSRRSNAALAIKTATAVLARLYYEGMNTPPHKLSIEDREDIIKNVDVAPEALDDFLQELEYIIGLYVHQRTARDSKAGQHLKKMIAALDRFLPFVETLGEVFAEEPYSVKSVALMHLMRETTNRARIAPTKNRPLFNLEWFDSAQESMRDMLLAYRDSIVATRTYLSRKSRRTERHDQFALQILTHYVRTIAPDQLPDTGLKSPFYQLVEAASDRQASRGQILRPMSLTQSLKCESS